MLKALRWGCVLLVPALLVGCTGTRKLLIETNPPGANLTVDNQYVGVSPQTVELRGGTGPDKRHSIIAEMDGHKRKLYLFMAENDKADRILVTLEKENGGTDVVAPVALKTYDPRTLASQPHVAVVPFEGNTLALQKGLSGSVAEMLSTALVRSRRYRVMERSQVKRLIEERRLASTSLGDPESLKKFGSILGVDYMVLGNVSMFEKRVRVDARLVSTRDGSLIDADAGETDRPELYSNVVNKIVNTLTAAADKTR